MESLYDDSTGDTGDTGVGETWEGGFPAELMDDLKQVGFDDPENDLGTQGVRGFAQLRGDWGGDFVGNMRALKETLSLLPPEIQEKYKGKPQLLNSPAFLKDVAKVMKAHQVEKENREVMSKNSLKFAGMAEVQRISDLRNMQAQLSKILFQHDSEMAAQAVQEGKPW